MKIESVELPTVLSGWEPGAPRPELAVRFRADGEGGRSGGARLSLASDLLDGLHGWWAKTVPVEGGRHYRFAAWRRIQDLSAPRSSVYATIRWEDDAGRSVRQGDATGGKRLGIESFVEPEADWPNLARPEYPRDSLASVDGWTQLTGAFWAPPTATRAVIALHLREAPGGRVEWSDVEFGPGQPPEKRRVALAAVNLWRRSRTIDGREGVPPARTPADACALFAEPVQRAAEYGTELICLPEFLTSALTDLSVTDAAEPVPGPSTAYFGTLSARHNTHIVAGLVERAGGLIYNTAVLTGPDGSLIGSYRKLCLPQAEIDRGFSRGKELPVFETRFGRVGIMICWDIMFPEVATTLASRGAQVIAVPVAGANPLLAAARAVENQVYLVTSTYATDGKRRGSLKTGVIDYDGTWLASTEQWGDVAIAEADLGEEPRYWGHLGDLKGQLPRQRAQEFVR